MNVQYMTKTLGKYLNSDRILLAFFFIVSLYMFLEAYSFSNQVARFPQLTAGVILVTCIILVLKGAYSDIPKNKDEYQAKGERKAQIVAIVKKNLTLRHDSSNRNAWDIYDGFSFLLLLTCVYIAAGYLIGLLWVTPLFVLAYTWRYNLPWYVIGGLSLLMFVFGYLMMVFGHVPLDQGILLR